MFRAFCVVSVLLITGTQAVSATCNDIASKVCVLAPVDYNPTFRADRPRPGCQAAAPNPNYVDLIQSAFNIAPNKLKEELCKVDNIFVLQAGAGPYYYNWGFWSNPRLSTLPAEQSGTFIGIREDDLNNGALSAVTVENKLLENSKLPMAQRRGHQYDKVLNVPAPVLGILSILAHEVGHIKWHRDNIIYSLTCYRPKFADKSWEPLTGGPNGTLVNNGLTLGKMILKRIRWAAAGNRYLSLAL